MSNPSIDPDMFLGIDDAVDAMAEIQRTALEAGKAVTVEIKEIDEMPGWLEEINRKVYSDSMRVLRVIDGEDTPQNGADEASEEERQSGQSVEESNPTSSNVRPIIPRGDAEGIAWINNIKWI
jgi:hypothetical protein